MILVYVLALELPYQVSQSAVRHLFFLFLFCSLTSSSAKSCFSSPSFHRCYSLINTSHSKLSICSRRTQPVTVSTRMDSRRQVLRLGFGFGGRITCQQAGNDNSLLVAGNTEGTLDKVAIQLKFYLYNFVEQEGMWREEHILVANVTAIVEMHVENTQCKNNRIR